MLTFTLVFLDDGLVWQFDDRLHD